MNDGVKSKWKVWIGLSVLVLGLTYGVQLVQQNQESRSKAASEELSPGENNSADCGKTDGTLVNSRPISDLCSVGSAIWTDSVAQDGDYNWSCVAESDDLAADCSAFLED